MSNTIALRRALRGTAQLVQGIDKETHQGTHILLTKLSRSVIPADIKRLCGKNKVDHVSDVKLDYYRFTPTGRAWVEVTAPIHLKKTLKALQNTVIGSTVLAPLVADPYAGPPIRMRGKKGFTEAVERGIVLGNGLNGGITGQGKNVVIYGLPRMMEPEAVRDFLKSFKLASMQEGQQVYKMEIQKESIKKSTFTSRYLVRLASVSEAHRVVRRIHMTYYQPENYGSRYPVHARVIY
ncbi:uncharacterized protein LAESUDRAFT_722434 [Laetiporus sulphureus 93-53]|uniref:RRM domain-containing protein n=1 Tax=Laetiporus sulphureus 93-53 TaxID=1314785 RepID=A0A165FVQ9_9APHY|nr:uncharacterized protein LAESUDRAFT_722434 [Laetiporus sulphureus 93-53]KZT09472.1 hypothetical protein LAESUDRAFT_722434 [Laetiporus sulphureus 93-53]